MLACMKRKSAEDLVNNQWVTDWTQTFLFPWVPVVGAPLVRIPPQQLLYRFIRSNRHNEIDVMTGVNTNEGSYFTIYRKIKKILFYFSAISNFSSFLMHAGKGYDVNTQSILSESDFMTNLNRSFIPMSATSQQVARYRYIDFSVMQREPKFSQTTGMMNGDLKQPLYRDAFNHIVGDYHIVCPSSTLISILQGAVRKSFSYILDYRISNIGWPEWAGVMHGYEIELAFGIPMARFKGRNPYSNNDRKMASVMLKYWANFAHTGNPNKGFKDYRMNKYKMRKGFCKINQLLLVFHSQFSGNTDGSQYLSVELPSWKVIPSKQNIRSVVFQLDKLGKI